MNRTTPEDHPITRVEWVDPATLRANSYNPNKVFPYEFDLLRTSILEDGWTQPVVARRDGEIVDGFHRWTLASTDPDVQRVSGGKVPVVYVDCADPTRQMMSTVRHNRARGQHGVLKMWDIVRAAQAAGLSDDDICAGMGMEIEEVERLSDLRGSPETAGKESFGKGWVPDIETKPTKRPRAKKAKAKNAAR
jgi:ParB-like chromosome segregation protein Spo0J